METIIITPKSKKSVPFLKHLLSNLDDVKSVKIVKHPETQIAKNLAKGLREAKAIAAGKMKAKTLDELLGGK
ncbi:MAG: hypothetical protein U5K79_10610 [Cyclobacteriaceae bacterium]|nr:hypothetical protein [Cyclobacteriaceae bacterium]